MIEAAFIQAIVTFVIVAGISALAIAGIVIYLIHK